MGTIYIKAPQCVELETEEVKMKDFLTIYCSDQKTTDKIGNTTFHIFNHGQKQQLVVSVLKVIEQLQAICPEADIDNIGESDFILSYSPPDRFRKLKEAFFTCFLCVVAFIGGGYAIMAYNTDVGAKELFNYLSMLFLGDAKKGTLYISITYAIGLTAGMLIFFNHLGSRRLSPDPTPLEVQMRLYENDVSTTIIKDMSRRGESIDINNG